MGLKIPSHVIIPSQNSRLLYNIEPVIIQRKDVTDIISWYRLAIDHDPMLERYSFVDRDLFYKYYYITLGLLEYPLAIVYGQEGGGKSLFIAHITYDLVRLFGKRATLDWTPPKPEMFGNFHSVYDEDFVEKIQHEENRLAKLEKSLNGQSVPKEELEQLITYNAVFGLDEGDSYADKSNRTGLTQLIGRVVRRRRHNYMCMFMAFVDPDDADKRMIFRRKTHEVECGLDWFPKIYPGWCTYLIRDVRKGGTGIQKFLHLNPADYGEQGLGIWRSHNRVSISHDIEVHLGGSAGKKKKEAKYDGVF